MSLNIGFVSWKMGVFPREQVSIFLKFIFTRVKHWAWHRVGLKTSLNCMLMWTVSRWPHHHLIMIHILRPCKWISGWSLTVRGEFFVISRSYQHFLFISDLIPWITIFYFFSAFCHQLAECLCKNPFLLKFPFLSRMNVLPLGNLGWNN